MSEARIEELLRRHAPPRGTAPSEIDGVALIRVTESMPTVPTTYPASLCFLVNGEKRIYFGGKTQSYGNGAFLCCTMPLPVESEIPAASEDNPVLGVLVDLETPAMMETLVAMEASHRLSAEDHDFDAIPGLVVSPADAELTDRVYRLLELLDDPTARQVLEGSRLRELCFALLRSGAGPALHRTFGASRELGRALAFLHRHVAEPLTVESLARVAGMSKAVFHRRFRAMTSLSPIQFIKAIRLNHAAALIVGGTTIAQSALQVGYSSPSQFSRDFSRQFGMSPRVWSTKHRGLKTTL